MVQLVRVKEPVSAISCGWRRARRNYCFYSNLETHARAAVNALELLLHCSYECGKGLHFRASHSTPDRALGSPTSTVTIEAHQRLDHG